MADEKVFSYRNIGTESSPNWSRYFIKTLAECVLMDANGTQNVKQYIDTKISDLVAGAPTTLDTLKELADAFSSNKTIIDALDAAIDKKAEKTELLYSNTTPTVQSHGGIAAGSTFTNIPITDMLTRILYPWVAPVVTAKVAAPSNGGTFEKGSTKNITSIQVTVQKKSSNITKVEIYNGTTLIATKSGTDLNTLNSSGSATLTFSVNINITANTTFRAKVTDASGKVTSADTGTFTFVRPYYYGVVAATAAINTTTIKGLSKKIVTKGTQTIPYTASNQRMVFASPNDFGAIVTITDPNNFNVTSTFTKSTISVTGLDNVAHNYHVYVSEPTTVANFNMKFAH